MTHHSQSAVTGELDGCFDKRGLPDPLVVTLYFLSHESELVRLVILRHEVDT